MENKNTLAKIAKEKYARSSLPGSLQNRLSQYAQEFTSLCIDESSINVE